MKSAPDSVARAAPYIESVQTDNATPQAAARAVEKERAARELAALLARVALGDRSAFERLYERAHRDLYGVAYRVLGTRDMAEEALQEAFVNIWHHAADYRPASSQAMTWMTHVVRNKALDMLRAEGKHGRRQVHMSLDTDDDDAMQVASVDPGPAELLARATDALGIRRCIETLEAAPRQALALAYYKGMSHSEVGEAMHAPVGTVKTWLRRSIDRLRHCLEVARLA